MADIASGDVTYTLLKQTRDNSSRSENLVQVAFGNGTLTYPSGGVPLVKGSLGLPTNVDELILVDAANANGFVYKVDLTNLKLRIYQGDNDNVADAALIELVAATATPAAATLKLKAIGW